MTMLRYGGLGISEERFRSAARSMQGEDSMSRDIPRSPEYYESLLHIALKEMFPIAVLLSLEQMDAVPSPPLHHSE